MFDIIQNIDWYCLHWIHNHLQCGFLDFIMPKITMLGDIGAIWLITAIILLFNKKYRKYGIMIFIGLAMGFLIGNICIKPLVARMRPCQIDSSIKMLVPIESDFSFPSGHTLASVIAATILTLCNKKFAVPAITLAILIAFSRLYLYMHFPSDVVASIVLGIPIALISYFAVNKIALHSNLFKHI